MPSEQTFPNTLARFKKSTEYILESLLTPYDFVNPEAVACGIFKGHDLVYYRRNVERLKSKSTWNTNFCRTVKDHEKPVRVISRNVAGIARTIELFRLEQTEPWASLVASSNRIPANEFGNVEFDRIPTNACFVACEDDLNAALRVCKSLEIPWARCQHGWKRKHPKYVGIVVLSSDAARVGQLLEEAKKEKELAEKLARDNAALAIWRVLIRRMRAEYYIKNNIDK